jgi:transposase
MTRLLKLNSWTPVQRMLLEQLHAGLVAARSRRQKLRHFMAKEALDQEAGLLKLARLCGISLVTMYGLSAAIGDITRFSHSKKLVAYLGLNPSVCQSGNFEGSTALKRHGKGPLRALLVQSAKRLLQVDNPLQKWGLAVAARRGRNKAAVAVARKLCVAIWHLLQGHPVGALEPLKRLEVKLAKLATELGLPEIKAQGYQTKTAFIEKKLYLLRSYP